MTFKRTFFALLLLLVGSIQTVTAQGWTQKADAGSTDRNYAVGFSIGTKGYIGTGNVYGGSKDFWEYDPSTNAWTQKADVGSVNRFAAVGFSIGTKGYIGTGSGSSYWVKDFWEYNPSTNVWTQKADFGGGYLDSAVGFSIGTKGYIGTGSSPGSERKYFWEYDPSTDIWTQKADFGGTERYGAVGFSIGTKGYIGTGYIQGSNSSTKDFWEYDASTNAWTQKADFGGAARNSAVGFSIGTKGYIGTGYVPGPGLGEKDFWEYNPSTNVWTQKVDFGGAGRRDALGFSIGTKGYIGTGGMNGIPVKDFWEFEDCSPIQSYTVTGTGAFCPGGSLAVGLSGSALTVNYQLKLGGVNVGSSVAGTGAALAFGNQSTAGTYTVEATPTAAGFCVTTMTGSAVLTAFSASITKVQTAATTATLTASAGDSYLWSTGATTQAVTVGVGTYTVDITNNAGPCTVTVDATVTAVALGEALNFDGTNDYVTIPTNAAFEFADGTVELWAKSLGNVGNNVLICNRNSGGARWSYHMSNTQLALFNGTTAVFWNNTFTSGTWYHIAFVESGSTTEAFVNGVSLGTGALTSGTATGLPVNIGSSGAGAEYFNGSIDEVRIWNVARTQAQIQANRNTELCGSPAGLVAYYQFNQGIAGFSNAGITSLTDASGNNRNGTLTNFALTGTTSNWTAPGSGVISCAPICITPTSYAVTGGGAFCMGGTGVDVGLANSETGVSYQLQIGGTNTGTAVPGTGVAISFGNQTAVGNYTVEGVNTLGMCTDTMTGSVNVSTHPIPTTGLDAAYCNTSAALTLSGSPSGGSFTINGSAATIFDPAALGLGSHTVVYTAPSSCTVTQSVNIVIPPGVPTITAIGGTTACTGANVTLTGVGTGGTAAEFAWFRNGIFVKYANTSADYTFPTLVGTNTYKLVVIHAGGGCPSSKSDSIAVIGIEPAAVITPSAMPPYCVGAAPTLMASTGTNYTYSWIGTSPTAATTTTSTFVPTHAGNHRVIVTDANGCSKSSAWFGVGLNALPAVYPGTNQATCVNNSVSIGVTATAGFSYSWTPSTHLSSATASNPTVLPTATGAINYTLTVTNVTGCKNTGTVSVTTTTQPATPSLTGTTSPVCQGTSITLTPSGVAGAVNWYKEGILNSSAATNAARIFSTANTSAENYTIRAKVGTCLSEASNNLPVEIKAAPKPTLSATPAIVSNVVSVCNPGQTSGTAQLMANLPLGAPTATLYNWQKVVSGIATNVNPAATTSSYAAAISTAANNKTFRAEVTYSNGCIKNTSNVTVKMLPSTCTARAAHADDLAEEIFTVYPNPTENVLTVSIQNSTASEGKLVLYNALGQIVTSRTISLTEGESEEILDLSGFESGVYSLSFQTEKGNNIQKIVKE